MTARAVAAAALVAAGPVLAEEASPVAALRDRLLVVRFGSTGLELYRAGVRVDAGPLYERLAPEVRDSPRAAELATAAGRALADANLWGNVGLVAALVGIALGLAPAFLAGFPALAALVAGVVAQASAVLGLLHGLLRSSEGMRGVMEAVAAYNLDVAGAR